MVEVPGTTIDSFGLTRVDLIKIDVDGMETTRGGKLRPWHAARGAVAERAETF